jgi:hypothetical protein
MTTPLDWLSIAIGVLGLVAGIVGAGVGAYQTRAMRKQSELYKEKCSIRYKDVADTVSDLAENIIVACRIVNSDCIGKSRQCGVLSANITSAMTQARSLIRFCNRLDEEFEFEFNKRIDETVKARLEDVPCRCVDAPSQNASEPSVAAVSSTSSILPAEA